MATTMDAHSRPAAFSPELAAELGTGTERPGWNLDVERRADDGRTLANLIGWACLGMGAAELLAPDAVEDFLGVEGRRTLVQACGVRDIGMGIGILTDRKPAEWMWGRVAFDVLDVAALATALSSGNRRRRNVLLALGVAAAGTALDVMVARQLSRTIVH